MKQNGNTKSPEGITHIGQLTPDPANANKGTQRGLSLLDNSLRKHGAGRSILIDKNGRIIAGNKTAERAADIGLDELIVVQTDGKKLVAVQRTDLDLNDPEARMLAYADNRTGEVDLSWNIEQLLADVESGLPIAELWNDAEFAALLEGAADGLLAGGKDAEPQIDKAAELQKVWGTAVGQVWELGAHRLAVGDCTDRAVVEAVMRGERAEVVFTDPPYGVDKTDWDSIFPVGWIDNAWSITDRMMVTPGNTALIYAGEKIGRYKDCGVLYSKNGMTRSVVSFGNWTPVLFCGDWKWEARKNVIEYTVNLSEDINHPSPKPLGAIVKLFEDYTRFGWCIADFFLGSGTTLIAAHQLGRVARGIEIDPGYAAVSIQRWVDLTGLTPKQFS